MPKPPSWIDKVNFITFWMANPCDHGLQVYFETASPALNTLMIDLGSFGLADLVRGFYRPRGPRAGRHGRKKRRGKRGKDLIPELPELIAKKLPGKELVADRKISDGIRHMWSFDGWAQKWLYRLLIISVVVDFAFDWISGIIKDPRSFCPTIARGLRRDNSHVFHADGVGQLLINDIIYIDGGLLLGPGSVSLLSGGFLLVLSCKARIFGPGIQDTNVKIGLQHDIAPFKFFDQSVEVTIGPGEEAELISSMTILSPASIRWMGIKEGEPVEFTQIEIFIMQMNSEEP